MRNRSNSGIRLDYFQRLVNRTILKYQVCNVGRTSKFSFLCTWLKLQYYTSSPPPSLRILLHIMSPFPLSLSFLGPDMARQLTVIRLHESWDKSHFQKFPEWLGNHGCFQGTETLCWIIFNWARHTILKMWRSGKELDLNNDVLCKEYTITNESWSRVLCNS